MNQTLSHLGCLISFDTRASQGGLNRHAEMLDYIRGVLHGFECTLLGDRTRPLGLYVRRGPHPRLLYCAPLNTAQQQEGWTLDPFLLTVRDGLAIGLGVNDSKGGIAALLTALQHSTGDISALFTFDDDPPTGTSVTHFIESEPHEHLELVVALAPTRAAAVLEHRGLVRCSGHFNGVAGHPPGARALVDSATHEAIRWGHRALDYAHEQQRHMSYESLQGICFNIGSIEAGHEQGTIAEQAVVRWEICPLPSQDPAQVAHHICELASRPWRVSWQYALIASTLPATFQGKPGSQRVEAARAEMQRRAIFTGPALDSWTSAARFSELGYQAVALGPGHPAQSNTPDEWIRLSEIEQSLFIYLSLADDT